MTKKVSAISNTCASVIGGGLLVFAGEIQTESLRLAITSLTPALTLLVAYFFKIAGSYGSLSLFKFLYKRKATARLNFLKEAINDPNISEEKRKSYQDEYANTLDIIVGINNEDLNELKTITDEARSKLRNDLKSGYQDNKELSQSLIGSEGNKSP